jgi:hypothetical protein
MKRDIARQMTTKMGAAIAVGATAAVILLAEVRASAAHAEDAIKPGKWEYWIVGSKAPEPPGTQLPPSMRWGPEGLINSLCISGTNQPAHRARTVPVGEKGSCDFDTTTDANAATVRWSMNCAWSSGSTSNTEGVAQFHDDILEGTTTIRHSFPKLPTQEYSSPIRGCYLGRCDLK